MVKEEILNSVPHREPFLFLDEVVRYEDPTIWCRKTFQNEDFFKGHYPHFPLVPGVILCEAAMQAGAVLLKKKLEGSDKYNDQTVPVVAKMTDIRFRQMVRPGDTILIETTLEQIVANACTFSASVTVHEKPAVKLRYVVMLTKNE